MPYKNKEENDAYNKKWREKNPEYMKQWKKNNKEKMSENFKGAAHKGCKFINGKWTEKKQEEKDAPEFMKKTVEFLEQIKSNRKVDVDVINEMEKRARTVDEAIRSDCNKIQLEHNNMLDRIQDMISNLNQDFQSILNKAEEEKLKPIRKIWYWAIKGMERDVEEIIESHDKWIEQTKTEFPKSKITLSLCQDVMVRNKRGQFEVVKDKE